MTTTLDLTGGDAEIADPGDAFTQGEETSPLFSPRSQPLTRARRGSTPWRGDENTTGSERGGSARGLRDMARGRGVFIVTNADCAKIRLLCLDGLSPS